MRTDWIKYNETWYYLNKDGTMATNTTIDNCYLNEKGIIEKTPINNKNSASDDNSENGRTSKHSVSSFEEARNIILKEDGQHIQNENKKMSKSNSYIQLDNYKQETIKDEAGGWGIPTEECYSILISNYYNGKQDSDSGMYLVGIKTGNVYILPHQGGVPAYQIKNNQVVKRFYGVESGASNHEWR